MKERPLRIAGLIIGALVLLAAAGALYQIASSARDAARFSAPGRLVDIGGRRLHLLCQGSGSPTVILESSGLGTVLQYQALMSALAGRQRTCAYDRAGLGWSDPNPRSATADHLERDLAALLRNGDVPGPYLFAASSAGGLVVELYLRRHPQDVAGMVWIDALSADMVVALPELHHVARTACLGYLASWFGIPRLIDPLGILKPGGPEAERAAALTYRTSSLKSACSMTRAFADSAQEIHAAPPVRSDLPTMVLVHGHLTGIDPGATPAELARFEPKWVAAQQALAAQFTGGRVEVVEDSGHLIATERPDRVAQALRDLAAQTELKADRPK